jgi:FlaA1/EpsC-like NDP-sugar epimerase
MRLMLTTQYQRRAVIVVYDALCIVLSYYLAYALRYESAFISDFKSPHFINDLSLNFVIQLSAILTMGIHRGLWRFASTKDLILIFKAVGFAIAASFVGTFLYNRLEFTPRSVYVLDAILLVISLSGGRFFYRMLKQSSRITHSENAILVGAGVAGEQLIREFSKNPDQIEYNISCILDDDRKKHGRTIHGIKIAGFVESLPNMVKKYDASNILIAIPTADNKTIRKIYDLAKTVNAKVNTLPPIVDLLSGKVSFKQMREVQVEDLMGR